MINLKSFIINENLKSHNSKQLKEKIKSYFSSTYNIEFHSILDKKSLKNKYDKKSFIIDFNDVNSIKKIKKDENFISLLQFYNYYITREFYDSLIICPLYPEIVTDKVNSNKYLYHFTTSNNYKSILKNGLRVKGGDYRKFPKRIYLYSTNKEISNNSNLPKKFIKKIINDFDYDIYGITIFKIDKDIFCCGCLLFVVKLL